MDLAGRLKNCGPKLSETLMIISMDVTVLKKTVNVIDVPMDHVLPNLETWLGLQCDNNDAYDENNVFHR